jgi:hypothetical protein
MTSVQWKDPARRAHRFTPVETKAGAAPRRMEQSPGFSTRRLRLSPSTVRGTRDCNLGAVSRNR